MIPEFIDTWQMKEPGTLTKTRVPMPALAAGDVVVKIAGCGVCHTDLSYFYMGVPTVQKPPLSLGHEISGTVIGGEASMIGKEVIVPAVIPCGECELCKTGRGNRCLAQKMPGNSMGIYGGFSSHIVCQAKFLCVIDNRGATPLEHLSVVADAVTTPYQAALRGDLKPGDKVIVVGAAGGVGSFMVQTAKGMGAKAVIGIDINEEKLQSMTGFGADFVINPKGKSVKEIKELIKAFCKEKGLAANTGWKIFEVTGSKPGQELALGLLSFTGKLIVVGYGTDETSYMLSKLMAFDAEIIGTWGCPPDKYPGVLEMCLDGRIQLGPFVETRPMSQIEQVFDEAHHGKLKRRVILTPDF
ncbi:6-hydroxycyclohex-1-ene-1-carbonyl-CoA dehydrogenase [Georgfuchsia toluolica]|uniref:6-hydroxycyclohex-1-ene-1-carbonyl-CoA dehydrogenase n=1 Tax=Georgfuchsia toluolica TaxID=424218 RepID=A0A916J7E4_9PROT|nr:6-hydroxycyclohex-1-ene-1-carbonyl-CoA dehydrogenase [Georgfuchsia toluolica]CAG4885395.1 6-hydroxycyclohex-1-ene-1-carbonyl-CoA dehydrogenase [Georgfuchsia toluolica]